MSHFFKLTLIILIPTILHAQVKSSEVIEFISKKDAPFVGSSKSKSFLGVIKRIEESREDLKLVDLYSFISIRELKMTEALCLKTAETMFGSLERGPLKIKKKDILATKRGPVCELIIEDSDNEAKIPERIVYLGLIGLKAQALVFRLTKPSDEATRSSTFQFWMGLK